MPLEDQMDAPEKMWLDAYRNGDVNALGLLVEHYRRPLFGYILRMIENKSDAEEIFQEVWFKAIRSFDSYKDQNFLSWMFRITHNHIIDRARKKKPVASIHGDADGENAIEDRTAAAGLDPVRITEGLELGERIRAAVDLLPLEQREVFLMRTEGQLPFKEIAVIMDCSINTALGRMQYALNHLREALKADYADFNDRKVL
jgi:RNA polymerase sigma-70 factor, ECF subfamily